MPDQHAVFAGSIPAAYDEHLGPVLFQPYADDLAARLELPAAAKVLELACGTGIVTRASPEVTGVRAAYGDRLERINAALRAGAFALGARDYLGDGGFYCASVRGRSL